MILPLDGIRYVLALCLFSKVADSRSGGFAARFVAQRQPITAVRSNPARPRAKRKCFAVVLPASRVQIAASHPSMPFQHLNVGEGSEDEGQK